jgi:spermidine synthase
MRRVYVLFFVSGVAGLVYQVVWSRLLHEVFGVTVYAVTAVLATFLLGLAAGGYTLGRLADRTPSALRIYGWLEIGVGLTAILGFALLGLLDRVHVAVASHLAPDSIVLLLVRVGLAAVVVLPPTFLMGGTLPAIARAVVGRIDSIGREVGTLYALNTAGAVLGTLLSGFWLIRHTGLRVTLALAVLANLIVGVVALLGSRGAKWGHSSFPGRRETMNVPISLPARQGLLVVMALSGFVTLGLEVLWTRVLVMSVGSTAYSFVTMLASFLIGLALGGFLVRPWIDRVGDLRRTFGWLELGIAASTLVTLPLFASGTMQEWLAGRGGSWTGLLALRFGVSLLVMLVPATLIGATFPIAARIWMHDLGRLGEDLGRLYGANTLGNILGAALTGFVILPVAGLQRGIVILTALSILCAAWGFFGGVRRMLPAWVGAAGCVGLLLAWQPAPFRAFGEQPGDATLFYREDVISTVKVLRKARTQDELWMTIDSIRIGQSRGGVDAKQQALAHFPFLLRPDSPPRRMLVIGLGTGILVGEAARHPSIERIDALEISPGVIDGARTFAAWNQGALDDERIHVVNDDGVNYLKRASEPYDVIVEDAKSRVAHAANSLFFSLDFYNLCHARLGKEGLFLQWVPLDVPPRELRTIVRTLRSAFDHVDVLVSAPHALFLAASDRSFVLDPAHIARVMSGPAAGLGRYGLSSAPDFLDLAVAADEGVTAWLARERTLNTLDRPVLEFYALADHAVPPNVNADENCAGLVTSAAIASRVAQLGPDPAVRRELADAAAASTVPQAVDRLRATLARQPRDPLLIHALTGIARRTVDRAPDDGEPRLVLAQILAIRGDFAGARSELERAGRALPGDPRIRQALAVLDQLGRRDGSAGAAEP